jgi:hypothetical protein
MDQLSNFTDHSEPQQFANFDAPIYNTPFDPNEFSNLDRFLNAAVIKSFSQDFLQQISIFGIRV